MITLCQLLPGTMVVAETTNGVVYHIEVIHPGKRLFAVEASCSLLHTPQMGLLQGEDVLLPDGCVTFAFPDGPVVAGPWRTATVQGRRYTYQVF